MINVNKNTQPKPSAQLLVSMQPAKSTTTQNKPTTTQNKPTTTQNNKPNQSKQPIQPTQSTRSKTNASSIKSPRTLLRSARPGDIISKIPIRKKEEITLYIRDSILGEQIKFLAHSLGYPCLFVQNELTIFGNLDVLPPMGRKLLTDFSCKNIGPGDYAGFTLDQNGRFLLASCLVTHNTQLAKVMAEAINQPFAQINMGGSTDPHHFLGHSYTYEGAEPGVIVKALKEMKCKSGIIYLDEFDKLGEERSGANKVAQAFLHISDPVQQSDFQDQYMPEIKIDLTNIIFIYSFNSRHAIDPILLNRIPIIEVPGYTEKDKLHIARHYAIPEILKEVGLGAGDVIFDDFALRRIITDTQTMDHDGLRTAKRVIRRIIFKINTLRAIGHQEGPLRLSYHIDNFKLPFTVTLDYYLKLRDAEHEPRYPAMYT